VFNWVAQIFAVTLFSMRSLPQRKGSSAAAMLGIAGVVAVMVGVLSIAQGVLKTMESSAGDNNAIVLRSGANSEMMSGLGGDDTRIIAEAPGIARDESGALASPELFVIINLPMRSTGTDANVPLRGVQAQATRVRGSFELVKGALRWVRRSGRSWVCSRQTEAWLSLRYGWMRRYCNRHTGEEILSSLCM